MFRKGVVWHDVDYHSDPPRARFGDGDASIVERAEEWVDGGSW
jgi:hypothetical protein